MNTQHTPGPWKVRKNEPWVIAKAYGNMKSVVHLNYSADPSEEQRANARLIAAAPDLLEALKLMLEDARHDRVTVEVFNQTVDAIAKATGGEV